MIHNSATASWFDTETTGHASRGPRSTLGVNLHQVQIAAGAEDLPTLHSGEYLEHAELCRAPGLAGAFELFVTEKLDALAGLVPALKDNAENLPGARVLEGSYTSVCHAFGTRPGNSALNDFTQAFIDDARSSGLVAELIEKHGVTGKLQVAGKH